MMNFKDLDSRARKLMLDEFKSDGEKCSDYYSLRLSSRGFTDWADLITKAICFGTPEELANDLRSNGRMLNEKTYVREGKEHNRRVPSHAAEVLAQGEFNRYYVRAICLSALEDGKQSVTVYRTRYSANPRPESRRLEGQILPAADLLEDVRTSNGEATRYGALVWVVASAFTYRH